MAMPSISVDDRVRTLKEKPPASLLLGQMASFLLVLGTRLQCNIVSYDYSGYGASQGKASEKNMYADIEAAYHSMKQRYHIDESRIILYGQSIGRSLARAKAVTACFLFRHGSDDRSSLATQ